MKTIAVILVAMSLSGCMLLGGENYIMSYGVEHSMDDQLRGSGFSFSATITGR